MIRLIFVAGALIAASLPASARGHARPSGPSLMKFSLEARLEQSCNGRAITEIGKVEKGYRPDEVVAYAFADNKISGSEVTAPGAAIRSHGEWYHLSYRCHATSDGLGVENFSYQLGPMVPRKDWDDHYLVP
ncbi:DUF930 domain-containing protein [Terrarubrum flagellatum]|uniref:DUF930 domain-containing protein n=1 Tax=Terrirubrum flagellatum TaxID=2895980 RepID=UPI003144F3D3